MEYHEHIKGLIADDKLFDRFQEEDLLQEVIDDIAERYYFRS